jgi:hypothetical protein
MRKIYKDIKKHTHVNISLIIQLLLAIFYTISVIPALDFVNNNFETPSTKAGLVIILICLLILVQIFLLKILAKLTRVYLIALGVLMVISLALVSSLSIYELFKT